MTPDDLADGWPDDSEEGIAGGERFEDAERPDPLVGRGLGLSAAGGVTLVFFGFSLLSVVMRGLGGQLPADGSAWSAYVVPGALFLFGLAALLAGRAVQRREAASGRLRAGRGGVGGAR